MKKTTEKQPKAKKIDRKLTLSKETVAKLTLRTEIHAGARTAAGPGCLPHTC